MMNNIDTYLKTLKRELRVLPQQRRKEIIEQIMGDYLSQEGNKSIYSLPDPIQLAREFTQDIIPTPAKNSLRLLASFIDLALLVMFFGSLFFVPIAYMDNLALSTIFIIFAALFTLGGIVLYFPLTEGSYGQTIGKWLTGILVVQEDGRSCSYGSAFLRRLPLWFGFFWLDAIAALFLDKNQRAFDRVARTMVIKTSRPKVAIAFMLVILIAFGILISPLVTNVRDLSVLSYARQWMDDSIPYTPSAKVDINALSDDMIWDFIEVFGLSIGDINIQENKNNKVMTISLEGEGYTVNFTAYKGEDAYKYISAWDNMDKMKLMRTTNSSSIYKLYSSKYQTQEYRKQGWQRGNWAFHIEAPKDKISSKDFNDLMEWIALKLKTLNHK